MSASSRNRIPFVTSFGLAIACFFLLPSLAALSIQSDDKQDEKKADAANTSLIGGEDAVVTGGGVTFGEAVDYKWKVGVKIATTGGSFKNVLLTIPVPVDWPEQSIRVLEENVPIEIGKLNYREVDDRVTQIVTKINSIPARKLVEFDVTFLVSVKPVIAPADTTIFQKPSPVPKEVRHHLGVGPDITYRKGKIRSTVKETVKGIESPWEQTEAIFEWVRNNIEHRDGEKQDSLTTFKEKAGNGEDLVGLFVAMCRANKVPARMVWVEGHQYAEFYLVDQDKKGHWFPCNVAGLREFGSYSDPRIIQQKGDNIKVPESKSRLKFVPEFVTGSGKSKPRVLFVRELLAAE